MHYFFVLGILLRTLILMPSWLCWIFLLKDAPWPESCCNKTGGCSPKKLPRGDILKARERDIFNLNIIESLRLDKTSKIPNPS